MALPIDLNPHWLASSAGYQIERSLRFNPADSAYLNRTLGTSNRKTFTFSTWVKRSLITSNQCIFGNINYAGGGSTNQQFFLGFGSSDQLDMFHYNNGTQYQLLSSAVYRDTSAWYHVVCAIDTAQATSSDRFKIYVNSFQVTAFATATYPIQNTDTFINANLATAIGTQVGTGIGNSYYLGGYLTEINFIDGQALTPSSFGETDSATGVWKPKAYTGTYGTNGFYLSFKDNTSTTTLGYDDAGSNDWTTNNFSVTAGAGNDSLVDTPTNYGTDTGIGGSVRGNYCTLNPLDKDANITFSNGNLDSVGYNAGGAASFGLTAGKWYWEVTLVDSYDGNNWGFHGVSSGKPNSYVSGYTGYPTGAGVWAATSGGTGGTWASGSQVSSLATWANSNVIGFAFDADVLTLDVYRNNVKIGSTLTVPAGAIYPSVYQNGTSGDTSATTYNFGQRAFAYTAPSGFKALCTQNLPTPTIKQGDDYFNAVLYTGNGTAISNNTVGFQPDWTWIKGRSGATNHQHFDSIRGVTNVLVSNSTEAETTSANTLTSFDSSGFTVGSNTALNTSAATYVAWNWRATSSNTTDNSGTITSTRRTNTTAGFSVITWTGQTSGSANIGHGLGVVPSMLIVKGRNDPGQWWVYHSALGATKYLYLNTTGAEATSSAGNAFANTTPTSTYFTVGTSFASASPIVNWVAYAFAAVDGYSAFGSYTGNGSADGPFVYTGFRPAFVMIKRTNTTEDWMIWDASRSPYNAGILRLYPNTSGAENSTDLFDLLSNGFKCRDNDTVNNGSGSTYIYAAFAENPFKYSLAR